VSHFETQIAGVIANPSNWSHSAPQIGSGTVNAYTQHESFAAM
jgi:hypothetical protein